MDSSQLAPKIPRFQGRAQRSPLRTQQLVARNRSILLKRVASIRLASYAENSSLCVAPRHQRRSGLALWLLLAAVGSAAHSGEA